MGKSADSIDHILLVQKQKSAKAISFGCIEKGDFIQTRYFPYTWAVVIDKKYHPIPIIYTKRDNIIGFLSNIEEVIRIISTKTLY